MSSFVTGPCSGLSRFQVCLVADSKPEIIAHNGINGLNGLKTGLFVKVESDDEMRITGF